MNKEFNTQYELVKTIRNEAISKIINAKESYIKKGNPDELILSMYDLEIEFLQKILIDM